MPGPRASLGGTRLPRRRRRPATIPGPVAGIPAKPSRGPVAGLPSGAPSAPRQRAPKQRAPARQPTLPSAPTQVAKPKLAPSLPSFKTLARRERKQPDFSLAELRHRSQAGIKQDIRRDAEAIRRLGIKFKLPDLPEGKGRRGLVTAKLQRFRIRVNKARDRLEDKTRHMAEFGNIVHPDMPHGIEAIVGDLIPDSPGEFALTVGTAGLGPAVTGVARGGAAAVRVARTGRRLKGAQKSYTAARRTAVAKQLEEGVVPLKDLKAYQAAEDALKTAGVAKGAAKGGLPVIGGGAKQAVGRAGERAGVRAVNRYQRIRTFSRSKKANVLRAGAFAGGAATLQATGDLQPIAKGLGEALKSGNIGQTAETTARGAIGLVTGPATLAAGLGASAHRLATLGERPGKQGSLEAAAIPTTRVAREFWTQAKREYEAFASKDPERISEAIQNDYGLWPFLGAGWLGRSFLKQTTGPIYRGGRERARGAVQARRHEKAGLPVPEGPARPIFPALEGAKGSIREARLGARERSRMMGVEARAMLPVNRKARRIRSDAEGQSIEARLDAFSKRKQRELRQGGVKIEAVDLIPFVLRSTATSRSREAALGELAKLERYFDEQGAPPNVPERLAIEALREVPELLTRPTGKKGRRPTGVAAFWDAVDEYRARAPEVPELGRSPVARRVPVAVAAEMLGGERILRPEEGVPVQARRFTGEQGERQFPQTERGAEMVPTATVARLREWDREKVPKGDLDRLEAEIRRDGIKEPLVIEFNPGSGYALLGEGNARLAVAQRLGIEEVPVRVARKGGMGTAPRQKGARGPTKITEPRQGYVRADLLPSEIGLPARAPRAARSVTTRREAVGTDVASYRVSEIAQERKALRAELRKKAPDEALVASLRERIAAKREAMGPVKLTVAERDRALKQEGLQTFPTRTIKNAAGKPVKTWSFRQRAVMLTAQKAKKAERDARVQGPLEEEFMRRTDEEIETRGLEEPAFIAQRSPEEGLSTGIPFERPGTTKDKLRTGELQRQGRIVEDYSDLGRTVHEAAARDAQMRNTGRFQDERAFVADLGEGKQNVFNRYQEQQLMDSGALGPNPREDYVSVPIGLLDDEQAQTALFGAQDPLAAWREIELGTQKLKAEGLGTRRMIFPRREWGSFLKQQKTMGKYEQWLSNAMTVQSRALLATSFAWMISQPFAEAIPLIMHDPNPARMIRATKYVLDARKDPALRRDLNFAADTVPGGDPATRTARGFQRQTHSSTQAIAHTPAGYVFRQAIKGEYIIGFDRAKGSLIREIGYAMEVDKTVNSQVHQFFKAVGGMYDEIDKVSGVLQTMNRAEQIRWLNNTKAGAAAGELMRTHLDDALGNWTALTPLERGISHFVIFYPFIRFSLDWTFRTFPKRHPIRYAIAGQMGQWNSEMLEKFLTHKPGFFSGWATIPVFTSKKGPPSSFISATRLAPGGNPFVEAAGDAENLGDLVKSTAPYVKTTLDVFGGRNIYGDPVEEDGKRTFMTDVKNLGEHATALTFPTRALTREPGGSPGSMSAQEYAFRSGLFPFLPESYKDVKTRATVNELWEKKSEASGRAEAPYPEEISDPEKYGRWKADDEAAWKAVYEGRGLSDEKAEEKAKLQSGKDVARYLAIGTKRSNPNYAEYKKYLQEYVKRDAAKRDVEKYNRRLIKLYGEAGVPLTSSLRSAYDTQGIDTGRSGPRYQREVGSEVARETVGVGPPYKIKPEARAVKEAAAQTAPNRGKPTPEKPSPGVDDNTPGLKKIKDPQAGRVASDVPPEYRLAVQKWGPHLDAVASRYGISGEELLAKTLKGESNFDMGAVSSAGARGAAQFMPGTRDSFVQQYGVDPYKSPAQAVKGMAYHLDGKHGHPAGLEGYNPGGGQDYVDYILGQGVGKAGGKLWKGPRGQIGGEIQGITPQVKKMGQTIAGRTRLPINVISGNRPGAVTVSGNTSDHSSGNAIDIDAHDMSDGGSKKDQLKGDRIAAAALEAAGMKRSEARKAVNYGRSEPVVVDYTGKNGIRVQVLWKTDTGGNHHNHVHVGLRGGSTPGTYSASGGAASGGAVSGSGAASLPVSGGGSFSSSSAGALDFSKLSATLGVSSLPSATTAETGSVLEALPEIPQARARIKKRQPLRIGLR